MRFVFLQFPQLFTVSARIFSSVVPIFVLFSATYASAVVEHSLNESARLTDMRLRAVLEAKSPKELKEVNERSERIKIGRIECEIQLKGRRVPSKCFEVLKDESEAGLIAASLKRNQEEWLAKLCKKRAQNSNDLHELNRLSGLSFIPAACHDQVVARALDLKYASESEDPSALFSDRFSQELIAADEASDKVIEYPPDAGRAPSRPESGQAAQKLQTTKTVVANHPSTNLVDGHEP